MRPETALELILSGVGGGFAFFQERPDGIVEHCWKWLREHREERERMQSLPEVRAIWLLDRLLPLDDPNLFVELRNRGCIGLFAWGRRAPEEMMDVVSTEDYYNNGATVLSAWIDSRGSQRELLQWYDVCAKRSWSEYAGYSDSLPVVEYCKRLPDAQVLFSFLETAHGVAAQEAMKGLLSNVAARMSPDHVVREDLAQLLESLGEHELASLCRRLSRNLQLNLARWFWIEQHTLDHIASLLDAIDISRLPVRRLSRILPKDRVDVWRQVFYSGTVDHDFAFCEFVVWLESRYRDILVCEFQSAGSYGGVPDRSICAFHAWLHKATRDEIEWWQERQDLPVWQKVTIDRFLNAPVPCRPQPMLQDIQDLLIDTRLTDPLSPRGI